MALFSRSSERELQLILEANPSGIVVVDADGRIKIVNAQTEKLFGYSREELIGQPVEMLVPVRFREAHAGFRNAFSKNPETRPMGAGRDLFGLRKDGTEFPIEIGLNAIKGRGPAIVLAVIVDIIERKRIEESLAQQRERLRRVIESAPNGVLTVDRQGRIALVNAQVEKLFGYSRSELIGRHVEMLLPIRLRGAHKIMREAFTAAPETRPMGAGRELYGRRKDGSEFPVEIGLNEVVSTGHGDVVLATIVDITERKLAQERQQLLVKEILHRTKNLMSVVQSIANQSLTGDRSLAEARELFIDRLLALSRTDSMLIERSLEGVELQTILQQELAGFSGHVDMQGCDLFLKPSAAQDFALLLHELATNAAKHGALSSDEGRVFVHCEVDRTDQSRIRFVWQESGGPAVAPPVRRGFGTTLLERVGRGLGESAELKFAREGLNYELRARLDKITPVSGAHGLEHRARAL